MVPDLSPIFEKYKALRAEADVVFDGLTNRYPDCVTCHKGCADCCHAPFDLSLVEAMYINEVFANKFKYGRERSNILERAAEIDRILARIKKDMYLAEKSGINPSEIVAKFASLKIPCPLLGENDECVAYEERPITCRLYGLPQAIGGRAYACGFSRFKKGVTYPVVLLEKFQTRLLELSEEIARRVGSRFDFGDVYVPLSMALLTRYDDAYLGVGSSEREE